MADEPTWTLAAETKEFVGPITVTLNGVPTTTFEVTVTSGAGRPTAWKDRDEIGARRGVLVGVGTPFPLRPGQKYTIWTRMTDVSETPVERVGFIRVI